MRPGGDPHGVARAARLRVVHPVDDLTDLVGDLVGRGVLVEVEPVLRDVLAVLDRLQVPLFRMEDEVDLLHHVERDGQAPLDGVVAHVVERLAVPADLLADRLQARVRSDLHRRSGIERGAQLLEGVDDALDGAVVVNPRHVEGLAIAGLEVRVR